MKLSEELRNKKSRDNRALLDRAADRIDELEKECRQQSEGEWVTKDLNNPLYESKKAPHCSNCEYMSFIRYDYCPNCGAKMKGGAE